jgi:hypothetical protein
MGISWGRERGWHSGRGEAGWGAAAVGIGVGIGNRAWRDGPWVSTGTGEDGPRAERSIPLPVLLTTHTSGLASGRCCNICFHGALKSRCCGTTTNGNASPGLSVLSLTEPVSLVHHRVSSWCHIQPPGDGSVSVGLLITGLSPITELERRIFQKK